MRFPVSDLSLCMILRDEADIIRDTLIQVKDLVDEIILVDTGSNDNTVEIISEFTDKIHHFKWIDNFSAARNFCDQFATKDFIMTWDADSRLTPESLQLLTKLKQDNFDDNDLILGSWVVERGDTGAPIKTIAKPIVYRRNAFHWEEPIHNVLVANSDSKSVKTKTYPEIIFFHAKSSSKHTHRGKQTRKIIERALKHKREPRLLVYYGELLLKENNSKKAEKIFREFLQKHSQLEETVFVLEKLLFIMLSQGENVEILELLDLYKKKFNYHPRFKLLYADAVAANDLMQAQSLYIEYLKTPVLQDNRNYYYDIERFYIHPRMMLANILISSNQEHDAIPFLMDILTNTSLHSTKKTANLLLDHIGNP